MVDKAREPLSSVDSAWLRMDEPGNLMVVTAVMMLDEPVPFERYRDLVALRLLSLPRLRQRVVPAALPFGTPQWTEDPSFELSYHVRQAPLDHPDQASLQQLVGRLMTQPFDPLRPLWQFHFIPHYEGGSAVVARFHHCIGDGLALLYVLLSMTDTPPPARAREPESGERAKGPLAFITRTLSPLVSFSRNVEESVVREVQELISRPSRSFDLARDLSTSAGAVAKLALMGNDPQTVFKGPLSDSKRAVWSQPIAIETVKEIARVTGSKINDVVLAAVAGGLRRYLVSRSQAVEGLNVRAVVPVNLRAIEDAPQMGNKFGLVFVSLPVGIEDPLDRIFAVRSRTLDIKRSPEALLTFQILRTIGITPSPFFEAIVTLFGRRSTAVMTNVIGPRERLRIAGTTLKQVMFWVPCSGRLGMGVSIFSYGGNVWLGIATDASLVPDPEVVIDGFHREMAAMVDLASEVRPKGGMEAPAATRDQAPDRKGSPLGPTSLTGPDIVLPPDAELVGV